MCLLVCLFPAVMYCLHIGWCHLAMGIAQCERLSAVWKSNELQTDLIKAIEDDDVYSDADDDKVSTMMTKEKAMCLFC